jgi:predicted metal-dependent peptidase
MATPDILTKVMARSDKTSSIEREVTSIKLIAHLERKRKSEVDRSLIEKGIKCYINQLKDIAVKNNLKGREIITTINWLDKSLSTQTQPGI